MARIEETIDVNVPVTRRTTSGRSSRSSRSSWRASRRCGSSTTRTCTGSAEIGGKREEWDAEITEQDPDQRIAWKSNGAARRTPASSRSTSSTTRCTRVMVQMDWEPEGSSRRRQLRSASDDRRVQGRPGAVQGADRGARHRDRRVARRGREQRRPQLLSIDSSERRPTGRRLEPDVLHPSSRCSTDGRQKLEEVLRAVPPRPARFATARWAPRVGAGRLPLRGEDSP